MSDSDDFEFSAPPLQQQQQQQLTEFDFALQERAAMLRATTAVNAETLTSPEGSPGSNAKRTAIIAGASAGGSVALILLLSLAAFFLLRRRRQRQREHERRLKAPRPLSSDGMLGVHFTRRESAMAVAVAPVMVQRPQSVAVPRRGKTLESMLIVAADRAFAEEQANRMVVDEDEDQAHAEAGPSRREVKTPAIAGEYYSVRWEDQKLTPRVTRPKVTISTSGWTNGRTAAGDADVTRPPAAYSPEDYKSPSELWRSTTTPAVPSPLQANLNPRSRTDSTRAPVVLSWTRMNDEHSVSDDESVRDGAGARALRRDSISRAAIVRSVHAGVPASVLGISAQGSARRRSNQVAA